MFPDRVTMRHRVDPVVSPGKHTHLVDNKEVVLQPGDDKPQVKLPQHLGEDSVGLIEYNVKNNLQQG